MESAIMTVRQIKTQAHPDHVGITVTEDQDIPPRNMPLWQTEYSELKKRRDTETHKKKVCDYGGKDWSAVSTSQGMPRIAGDTRNERKGIEQILL